MKRTGMDYLKGLQLIKSELELEPKQSINKLVASVGLPACVAPILTKSKLIQNTGSHVAPNYLWITIKPNIQMGNRFVEEVYNYQGQFVTRKKQKLKNNIPKSPKRAKTYGWTDEETQFLIDNYPKMGRAACAKALDRTIKSVEGKRYSLGLSKVFTKKVHNSVKSNTDNVETHSKVNNCKSSKTISIFWGLFKYSTRR